MLSLFLVLSGFTSSVFASELKVSFDDLMNKQGKILYLVFNQENGFPDDSSKSVFQGEILANEASAGVVINLQDGQYAMTLVHDENDNGKLDTGFMGIPKEGFGFSNNLRILFGPPSFEKASFKIKGNTSITIKVKYF